MKRWLNQLIRCVYPPVCAICRRPCQPANGWPAICRLCLAKMPLLGISEERRPWPEMADADRHPDDLIFACMAYEEPIRSALIRLKFFDETDIAELVAELLYRLIRRTRAKGHAVMAVPLHPARLRERGYNQSSLIAAALARKLELPDRSELLVRIRATPQQSLLTDRRFRQENVRGAFAFHNESPSGAKPLIRPGSTVWLVDDIMTTGATLTESARPLWRAGLHVYGLAAALVSPVTTVSSKGHPT
ncbi:MAG: ComF family protein [Clostridia bacterium]|nr:ComF family protein [Eubacteriales bacterium]NCC48157.1 ComF family protein [Clostridia bacterium]